MHKDYFNKFISADFQTTVAMCFSLDLNNRSVNALKVSCEWDTLGHLLKPLWDAYCKQVVSVY